MFNDLFFYLFLSEPFYLSHTKGSYTDWGRGVDQERDIIKIFKKLHKYTSTTVSSELKYLLSYLNNRNNFIYLFVIMNPL